MDPISKDQIIQLIMALLAEKHSKLSQGDISIDERVFRAYEQIPPEKTVQIRNMGIPVKIAFCQLKKHREYQFEIKKKFYECWSIEFQKIVNKPETQSTLIHSQKISSNSVPVLTPPEKLIPPPLSAQTPDIPLTKVNKKIRFSLKNAKVGMTYSDELNLPTVSETGIKDWTIENIDSIGGLQIDKQKFLIYGIPLNAGKPEENYDFMLKIRFETSEGLKDSCEVSLKVLPDPKSLWKTIEPDETIADRKPNEASFFAETEIKKDKDSIRGLRIIAASKRGRSHAHEGLFRDDHFKIEYIKEENVIIACVADGAGSAKLSRVGSQIACDTAIGFIKQNLTELHSFESEIESDSAKQKLQKDTLYRLLGGAANASANKISAEANIRGAKMRDFHTTFLIVVYKKLINSSLVAGLWIGDGAIGILGKDDVVNVLGIPDSGDFGGQTRFLTMNEVLTAEELYKRVQFGVFEDFKGIILMTDGISDPKFETDKNLFTSQCWIDLWNELNQNRIFEESGSEQRLLEWLDFWSEGNHDDRTIVVIN